MMSDSMGIKATRYPFSYAATAGALLGAVQAGLFALRGGGPLGFIIRIGLTAFLVGTVIWWLLVARRKPEEASLTRGVMAGALSVVISTAMFPLAQIVSMVASGLRTETAGNLMEAAGEGALLGVAGLIVALLQGWMDLLGAMIAGGLLVHWHRRRSGGA